MAMKILAFIYLLFTLFLLWMDFPTLGFSFYSGRFTFWASGLDIIILFYFLNLLGPCQTLLRHRIKAGFVNGLFALANGFLVLGNGLVAYAATRAMDKPLHENFSFFSYPSVLMTYFIFSCIVFLLLAARNAKESQRPLPEASD